MFKYYFLFLFTAVFGLSVMIGYAIHSYSSSQLNPVVTPLNPQRSLLPQSTAIPVQVLDPVRSLEQLDFQNQTVAVQDDLTRVLVTGDVLLARSVNAKIVQRNDMTWPFVETADKLRSADITFINLETPLVTNCPVRSDGMIFCGDPRGVEGLQFAGIDVVNLANNHIGNWGEQGVAETKSLLENANIKHTGVNDFTVIESKGVKFAFLGFNEVGPQIGIPVLTEQLLLQQIEVAKNQADVVIVQFHWGAEYTYQPTTSQQRWGKLAIDGGADVVIGNHPHWWQPIEFYKQKPIIYSHGNFIFDQMWSLETRIGLVGEYIFQGEKLVNIQFHPVRIEDYGQPRWLQGEERSQVLNAFMNESLKIENSE